jgi:hypothetical protein
MDAQLLQIGSFTPRRISVRVDPMLRIQGYSDPRRVKPAIRNAAETVAATAERVFTPEVYYRRVSIRSCTERLLLLETGTTFHSAAFSQFLGGCHQVIVFVLTLGNKFDQVAQNLTDNGQTLEALFFETAGWLGVEAATKSFAEHLRTQLRKEGCGLTRRFGPGYTHRSRADDSEWRLEEQKPLFALFEDHGISVQLLDSCAMIPKMSRSGLYGVRRKAAGQ